ncbi:hypothetical protein DAEQUDRAFT_750444 [Daedalea quercina L-15889]|uniref:XRRM domain-containing protein n=1 Tax=Daedalea quercina L-15889 TaxID=1314783 RepID=A0A165R546_9APHY|nr:hypothetical protein DAEQUDRAFT_750444 [Daedalea quercina L-15889]
MLPFIPRKVARASKSMSGAGSPSQPRRVDDRALTSVRHAASAEEQAIDVKGKGKATDIVALAEDIHTIISLALSDHAIWADSHLRSRIVNGSDGYIPLQFLLSHSAVLSTLDPSPTEAAIVKVIRAQNSDLLDVRVLVSAPSRAAWYGKESGRGQLGGYEVRRQDWAEVLQCTQQLTEDDWAARSIYIENIPSQYRTTAAIARFIHSLVSSPNVSMQIVQNIWLPPHAQDKPGERPKCKGFALIILSSTEHADGLARHWPWNIRRTDLHNVAATHEAQEAVKFGFRIIPRGHWDKLKEEYLAYRETLLDALACAEQVAEQTTQVHVVEEPAEPRFAASDLPTTDLSSPYPQGCLVFVRNIHTETNKTTLRALFSQAVTESDVPDAGVDYVDFSKGMDTCYLRLASARYTRLLTAFFTAHPTAQSSGLDTTGVAPSAGTNLKPITLEVVEGMREELYWNKVPEKVRRQAVEKAMTTADIQPQQAGHGRTAASDSAEGKRKRKRRRRGE